jgi:uncharacterized damage-inducible protein DinB
MKATFAMLAGYNAWANGRVYDAAVQLSDAEYRADRGAFFKSMHGTLNHLLVADRVWMRRFTAEGDAPSRLDAILFDEFLELRAAREAEDARITSYIDGLTEDRIAANFRYSTIVNPREIEQPLGPALTHFFNHQTHHRGQAHAILTGLGREAPVLDLIAYQRATGVGMS